MTEEMKQDKDSFILINDKRVHWKNTISLPNPTRAVDGEIKHADYLTFMVRAPENLVFENWYRTYDVKARRYAQSRINYIRRLDDTRLHNRLDLELEKVHKNIEDIDFSFLKDIEK